MCVGFHFEDLPSESEEFKFLRAHAAPGSAAQLLNARLAQLVAALPSPSIHFFQYQSFTVYGLSRCILQDVGCGTGRDGFRADHVGILAKAF